MSIGRRLAEKYSKKDRVHSETVVDALSRYGLLSVVPQFAQSLEKEIKNDAFYTVCRIVSATALREEEVKVLQSAYNIPTEAEVVVEVREEVLDGVVVYYQGKKWNGSAQGALARFKEL